MMCPRYVSNLLCVSLILMFFGTRSSSGQQNTGGILFPQESETRERKSLDGIWNFRISPRNDPDLGFRLEWYNRPLDQNGHVELMPVPSSYNDITQSKLIRDHVGWAWYDREFRIPKDWFSNQRIWLRFGGVNYHAIVWVNGIKVLEHSGGHLPFLAELSTEYLSAQSTNRITVAVNNTLSSVTIPQGRIVRQSASRYPVGYFTLDYAFDFFNYAGIHRTVYLYSTPVSHIDDIKVTTDVQGSEGLVSYFVDISQSNPRQHPNAIRKISTKQDFRVSVRLEDKAGVSVATSSGESGVLRVTNAKLWWPFTMVSDDSNAGYRYTLVAIVLDALGQQVDVYRLKIGIRTVKWNTNTFFINDRPFYFRGFGRHEDFNIRGKGIDPVMLVKDHNLVKWTGANSYRTSHYPYSEEIMDLTDELGIVIIDEISAVSIDGFGPELLATHKSQLTQLIHRDKNRPSVVMWSVSNEPQSQKPEAGPYFKEVFALTKSLDSTRPVTIVLNQQWSQDKSAQYADIICINRYYAWYSDTGHTEVITNSVIQDVNNWVNKFNRPLIISEYGSDTVAGLHMSPDFVFTEEFQIEYLKEHFKAFDALRQNGTLIGEMIWNFADFMTVQGITRIVGNRKGVFTRDRQPKASAHLLRTRYHLLANELEKYPLPTDLRNLIPIYGKKSRTEL
ncbi:beta-glucuronidase isoform X2 [Folsomia candida]|uniref:Beta-glucuronidase n=1 Tax=Folsomia candida TaxID=158441 RepID=A0A226F604_FOLCA|nr:beta-glucuronidase isoform X2 [Folsomia candida]OXA64937.1 Beta-glucuronidase [Folsomia candida]